MNGSTLDEKVESAKNVLAECFERYQVDEVGLAFNGGKDCSLVLSLMSDVLGKELGQKVLVVHFADNDEFEEVQEFVQHCKTVYCLDRFLIMNSSIKDGLWEIHRKHPSIKAFITGRRSTDPYAETMTFFTESTKGWAPFMRVSPVLNWTYSDVWNYIAQRKVPYCKLYDQGYTSLGSKSSTVKNASLLKEDGTYKPASECEPSKERLSRVDLMTKK